MVFDPKLSEVQLSQSSRGGGASVGAAVVSGVAGLGIAVAGLVGTIRDSKAIKGFQGELDVVGKEASAFTEEFKRLSGELDESSDKGQISNLHDQLSALQRGKTQFGDRASFRTKAGVVLKKFLAANPHLADEGASLFGASSFGVGIGGARGSVDLGVSLLEQQIAQEEEQISQVMVDLNISRTQARAQFDHSKMLASAVQQGEQEATLAVQNRVSVFAGMLKITNAGAASATKVVMQQVLMTIANPDLTFDSVTSLGIFDQQMSLIRAQRQSILQSTGQGALSAKELKDLDDNVASYRANLEGLLNSKDPVKAIKRQAERQAIIDLDSFNRVVSSTFGDGETSAMIRLMGAVAGSSFMMNVIPQVLVDARGKSPEQLRRMHTAALELGEGFRAAAIGLLLSGDISGYYGSLAKADGSVKTPPPEDAPESTESFMDSVSGFISSKIFGEEIPPDTDERTTRALLNSAFSATSTASINNLLKPGGMAAILQSPALIKHTNNLIDRQLFDIMDTLQTVLPDDLEIVIDQVELGKGATANNKTKSLFRLRRVGVGVPLKNIPAIPFSGSMNVREVNKLVKDLDYLSALVGYSEKINLSSKRDTLQLMENTLFTIGGTPTLPKAETPEVKNKKPFSFLSTATTSELVTLASEAKDEPLLKAIEEERKRRGES